MTIYSLDVILFLFGTSRCSMSSSNCSFLTCIQISQEAGQVVWYSHLLKNFAQLLVIHTVKGFGIVNKAEIDVFLELSCFFDDPTEQWKQCQILFFWAPKSLQMVIAAMKLKDAYSLVSASS